MTGHAMILGGAGFVGSWLADRALTDGWRVTVVDNYLTGNPGNLDALAGPVDVIEDDVRGEGEWLTATKDADLIFHLASPASPTAYATHPIETLEVNAVGTRLALDAARDAGSRLVFTSTSEVYGDPAVHPQVESYNGNVSCDGPRSMYDEGKRYAEAMIAAHRATYSTRAGVVRLFNTYGPRMDPADGRVIPTFITQARAGEPLTIQGDGQQTRSLCYASDTAEAIWRYGLSAHSIPVNIGNPEEVTVLDLAAAVSAAVGVPLYTQHVPAAPDDPTRRRPDITRANTLLNWHPTVALLDGIARTLAATP